jgi:hypothetical protein
MGVFGASPTKRIDSVCRKLLHYNDLKLKRP